MSKAQGWVPKQHGAWAMLIVPFVAGAMLRSRVASLDAWLLPLAAAELAAYLCFNSLTLWLRAAPARRGNYVRPLVVYAAITAVFGLASLLLGGWPILGWLPIAVPLGGLAVWLAAQRKDRAVLSGLATVAMASGMGLVVRFITPGAILAEWPASRPDAAVMGALFGYFFGTVWHVKALIRERGQRSSRLRSLAWHGLTIFIALGGALIGWTSWWWIIFFAIALARTWWMTQPKLAGQLKPLQIGVVEIVLSLIALLIAVS